MATNWLPADEIGGAYNGDLAIAITKVIVGKKDKTENHLFRRYIYLG
jgi:hypothetical protein